MARFSEITKLVLLVAVVACVSTVADAASRRSMISISTVAPPPPSAVVDSGEIEIISNKPCVVPRVTAGCIESSDNNPVDPESEVLMFMQFASDGSISNSDEFTINIAAVLQVPPESITILEFGSIGSRNARDTSAASSPSYVAVFEIHGRDEPEAARQLAGLVSSADPVLAEYGFYQISLKEVSGSGVVLATVHEPPSVKPPTNGGGEHYYHYDPVDVGAASMLMVTSVIATAILVLCQSF
jgi:hypothetical protein